MRDLESDIAKSSIKITKDSPNQKLRLSAIFYRESAELHISGIWDLVKDEPEFFEHTLLINKEKVFDMVMFNRWIFQFKTLYFWRLS